MLGFGKKSVESATNSEEKTSSTTDRDTDMEILKVPEVIESAHSPKTETNAENDTEILNLHTKSLVLQANDTGTDSDKMVSSTEFSLTGMTEHGCSDNRTDCVESLTQSERGFQEKTSETQVSPTKSLFTDDVLELFCMNLVNKVGESQHSFDSDEGNVINSQHIQNEQNLFRFDQNSSFLHLLNVFNSIEKKEFEPDSDFIDFVPETDELVTEIPLLKQRENRFVNFPLANFLGFGSGRSADSDESNNIKNENVIKFQPVPSVIDCEIYFRKKQNIKMFPKPNLMDMINDPKIQLVDFVNATTSSKLNEQNIQFLTDLIKTNLNNTDTFGKQERDTDVAKSNSEKNLTRSKDIVNVVHTNEILNVTESNDSQLRKSMSTSVDIEEVLQATESQRAAKLINFLSFGSGFFRNGVRSIEASDSTESDKIEEFGSGEQFSKTDVELRNFGQNESQERVFGLFGSDGSGDGRELAEDENTTETDAVGIFNKDYNEVITEKFNDCDENSCNLENPLEHNRVEHVEDILRNESKCSEDCFSNFTMDYSKTDYTEKNISVEQIRNESKNLGEHFKHNCSCYETIEDNITFFECNECNFEDVQQKGEFHASLSQSLVLRNESEVKFQDDYENNCYNCDTEEKLVDKNINYTSKNMSFLECDECRFNSTNIPKGEFAREKPVKSNVSRHNLTFQECDDCSFSSLDKQKMHESTESLLHKGILSRDTTIAPNDYEIKCHDCNDAQLKKSNENVLYLGNGSSLSIDVRTPLINADSTDHVKLNKSTDVDNTINVEVESLTDINRIQKVVNEETTESQNRSFMGTIFLTGSGDGGLFADSVGPINLMEEESTSSPGFSRKRGRSDDSLAYPTEMWNENDLKELNHKDLPKDPNVSQISTSISPNFRSLRRGRLNDDSSIDISDGTNREDSKVLNDKIIIAQEEITTVSDFFSDRIGKLDARNLNSSSINEDASNNTKTSEFEVQEKINTAPEKKIIKNIRKTEELPLDTVTSDILIPTNRLPRFCSSASDCNGTLNERCITVKSSPICTCGRAYVRHKETGKCVVKRIVRTSMKLPAEKFDEDLKDTSSKRYKEMKKYATDWMSSLLRAMPNLWPVISQVDVVKFSPGSLIVSGNIVFAVENESEEKLIKDVSDGFQKALQNQNLRMDGPLNVSHASLISVNSVDPCKAGELNECYCEWKASPEGFTCHCSEQFRDISIYSHHIEETCQESCSPDYCSFNGHCEIIEDKRMCFCSGMYFGRRCDVPGLFILIILVIIALISIVLMLIVILGKKCRTGSYRGSQTLRRPQEAGPSQTHGRVSDAIAMEENVGAIVSKFVPITTPTQHPVIKIIKPTVSESITSFEYDCQFDDSPSSDAVCESGTTAV